MGEAARLGDPISHTSALAGFLVGAVLGVALIAAVAFATVTCGFGAGLIAGLLAGVGASALLALGEAIGKMFSTPTGTIITGSPNVIVNGRPAAMTVGSTVACAKDVPVQMVAMGCATVQINGFQAARNGDSVTCGAKISDGSPDVVYDDETVQVLPVADEVPPWLRTAVGWAFTLAGLTGGLAGLASKMGGVGLKAFAPCAARFIAGFVVGEAVGRYVISPAVSRVYGAIVGHPVDVTTGRKLLLAEDEVDFVVRSPIPVVLARFYASDVAEARSLGRGWVLPWELRLQRRDGVLWLTDAQGRESSFPELAPGEVSFDPRDQRWLARTRDGRYVLRDLNEVYREFEAIGEHEGATAGLRRIEDQAGQWQDFVRDEHGRVSAIRTSGGREVVLVYTPEGDRLASVHGGDGTRGGPLVEYLYDEERQLVAVRDANGRIVRRFTYEHGLMTSHANALGFTCRYEWGLVAGAPRVLAHETSEGERIEFGYDVEARRSWIRDDLGRSAEWHYDEHRNVTECTDLDGSRYAAEYEDHGLPAVLHLPGDRTVHFEYDPAGRLTSETDTLGRTTTMQYAGDGLRMSQLTLPDGRSWWTEFDVRGRALSTTDPLGRVERYEYPDEATPWPSAHVDARGGRRQMQWSRSGELQVAIDCSGKPTRYEHDADGQLTAVTNALGERVEYARRRTGELTSVQLPDGSREAYERDAAGLLVGHRNAAGHVREWLRNARGQVTQAIDAADRSVRYRYDARGRLMELRSDTEARYLFEYDAADRLVHETRPDDIERHLAYDEAGHLVAVGTKGTTDDEYAERPTRVTRLERDQAGRLLARSDDTARTTYAWSEGDRLQQVERVPTAAGLALGVQLDTLRFDYDTAGRLVAEHGANGTVAYELDELDTLEALQLPHGQRLQFASYGSGHVHRIAAGGEIVTDIERDDLHREVLRTQGLVSERTGYDALGRRLWQSVGEPEALGPGQGRLWRSYRYNRAGELARKDDGRRGSTDYRYDPAGQLLGQRVAESLTPEQFAWDAAGNLLDEIERKSRGYVQGNRLRMWQDIRFEYDAWGNVTTKRRGARQVQVFTFDAENRLLKVVTKNGRGEIETSFEYDALGRRIGKTEKTTEAWGTRSHQESVRFVWQGLRLVQEIDPDHVRSYVYSPDAAYTPLARLDVTNIAEVPPDFRTLAMLRPRVLHFHTDQIGTPQEVTDQDGELLWAGQYDAWGKVRRDGTTPRIEQPLRFAGQYADARTGLHYNTFRYYDPDVGRFISADPIGLRGGANLYAYGPNSTGWIDPLGWAGDPVNATHITYVGVKDGKPYVGYASKPGLNQPPEDVLKYRYPNTEHFDVEPKVVYSGNGQAGKDTARGLEQRLFEQKGGLAGTSNKQNPVGLNNSNRERYLAAADEHLAAQEGGHGKGSGC
jgi:RHS repeat-associated protein